VVQLLDVFADGTGFVLAFELMPGDLGEMIRDATRPLTEAQAKTYMVMLMKGVAFLHHNNIMHRVNRNSSGFITKISCGKQIMFELVKYFFKHFSYNFYFIITT
jgi:cell cycle related kinase